MKNDFVKYLFLFLVGMLGVFIGRRMAIKRMMEKESSSNEEDMV